MAFLDKLNDLAKNIGDKTNDAIETTKLNSKINAEKSAAAEDLKKIGEHYYSLFAASGEAVPEVMEFCQSAKAHYDVAADAQSEIERIKAENEAEKTAPVTQAPAILVGIVCPSCGAANGAGTKFCQSCGAKLVVAQPQERKCPACGAVVAPSVRFCSECGQKMEE